MRRYANVAAGPALVRVPALALLLLTGCATLSDPTPHHSFLVQLDPAAAGASLVSKPAASVYVAPVIVAEPFSERSLVIRQSEVGFELDPYDEFAASPASMWTDAVREWLATRRLFERVLSFDSSADADLTLEDSVLEAVTDRRPGQPATSLVTMRFLLIRNGPQYQVLLDRTFTRTEPVKGMGAEGEVAALSRAASGVLRDFEEALAASSLYSEKRAGGKE